MRGLTLETTVRQKLRTDILWNSLPPNHKLRVAELSARYGVGSTPIREALSRLVSEGLVTSEGNKGFRVAPVSLESLIDLTRARQIIEGEAFYRSIMYGDSAWEGEIVGRFHRLSRAMSERVPTLPTDIEGWETLHKGFHRALLAACGVSTLLEIADRLYDLGSRYRFLMLNVDPLSRDLVEEHRQLMEVALERDATKGADLLRAHLHLTTEVISAAWRNRDEELGACQKPKERPRQSPRGAAKREEGHNRGSPRGSTG